jgi:hypothetical protein
MWRWVGPSTLILRSGVEAVAKKAEPRVAISGKARLQIRSSGRMNRRFSPAPVLRKADANRDCHAA